MLDRFSTLAMSAIAVVATAAASQAALLTYDVRATGGTAGDVTVTDTKTVKVTAIGDVIHFAIYGVLATADNDATNDGITAAGGSILSGAGGLLGTLGGAAVPSANGDNFQGVGFSTGTQADLDSDTDSDIGSNLATSNTGFFIDRSNSLTSPVVGNPLLLGTFDFTVTSLNAAGTTVNFRPAVVTSGGTPASRNYHNFQIDGAVTSTNGSNSSLVAAGQAVAISVAGSNIPEPTSFAALAIGGATLLRRKRTV